MLYVPPISPTSLVLVRPSVFHGRFSHPVTGLWTTGEKKAKFGYDFWYQPYWDVMISSEWAAPKSFKKGFALPETQDPGTAQDSKGILSALLQFIITIVVIIIIVTKYSDFLCSAVKLSVKEICRSSRRYGASFYFSS